MVAGKDIGGIVHVIGIQGIALLDQAVELVDNVSGKFGPDGVSPEKYRTAAGLDVYVSGRGNPGEVLVLLSEKLHCQVVVRQRQFGFAVVLVTAHLFWFFGSPGFAYVFALMLAGLCFRISGRREPPLARAGK